MIDLIKKFQEIPPKTQRTALIGGSFLGVFALSAIFVGMSEKKASSIPRAAKPEVQVVQPSRMTGVEQFGSQMDAIEKQLQELNTLTKTLKKENEELRDKIREGSANQKQIEGFSLDAPPVAPGQILEPVSMEQAAQPDPFVPPPISSAGSISIPPALPTPSPFFGGQGGSATPLATVTPSASQGSIPSAEIKQEIEIRVIGESGEVSTASLASDEAQAEAQNNKVYIPSGSMFTGVLLNGLDAPTSSVAKKNPMPVVMRVKREAVLPNYAAIDVRECFLMAAGYGQLASERAMLRAENLSCVRTDGQVFETKIDAYIVGSDGKVGVPGRLVSKQGQMIARSLMAGIFGGMGSALNRTRVPSLNINPNNGTSLYEQQSMDMIFQGGLASGIGTSANMVAKFYLDMAKETFPVVEIPAGEVGTIVVTKGSNLPLKGSSNLKQYIDPDQKNRPANQRDNQEEDEEEKPTGLAAIPDELRPEQALNAMGKATQDVQQMFGGGQPMGRNNGYSGFGNGGW